MELVFYYKRSEYINAKFKYINHLKIIPAYLYIIFSLLVVGAIVFMATKIFIAGGILLALALALLLFYLSITVFIPLSDFNKSDLLKEDQHIIFDNNEVQLLYNDMQIYKDMSDYKALYESKKYFYFVLNTNQYTLIPKRLFDDPEDEKLLREIYIDGTQGAYKSI